MEEKWDERELILNQKHEEILKRREALLLGSERYYDFSLKQPASFLMDIGKAITRNDQLQEELNDAFEQLRRENRDSSKFQMLKNNYWTMVRNVFPVWYSDLCEYEANKRPSSKVISQATTTISKTLAGPSGSIYSDNPTTSIVKPKRKSSSQNRSAPATTRTSSTLQKVRASSSDSLVFRSPTEQQIDGNIHHPRSSTKAERSRSFQSLPRNAELSQTGKTSLRFH